MQRQLIGYLLGILTLLLIGYLLLKRIGLIESKEEEKVKKGIVDTIMDFRSTNLFDRDRWQTAPRSLLLSSSVAKDYTKKLNDAMSESWFWGFDDESQIFAIFRGLTSKFQISQLADEYYRLTNDDLLADLLYNLNNEEEYTLAEIINNI